MKCFARISLLLAGSVLVSALSACNFFSQPADLQTENLQNEVAQTQISGVRGTATVNADRLIITLESAQTAVGNVDLQSTRIASTMIAQGVPFVDASALTPVISTEAAPANDGSALPQIANPLLTPGVPQVSSQGSAQGDSPLVQYTPTPFGQPTIEPVNDGSNPSLTAVTLTDQVGSDDCPLNPMTSFSADATDIYVTAVAHNIQPNTSLAATFARDGQDVQNYPWTPGFAIDGACIWFHMPADEVAFTPGNWTVALSIDGAAVGTPLAFSIVGDTPTEIDTASGG